MTATPEDFTAKPVETPDAYAYEGPGIEALSDDDIEQLRTDWLLMWNGWGKG